jgi:integration host factor subunit beta
MITRSELITRLSMRYPDVTEQDMYEIVRLLLDAMAATLSEGNRIEIRGMGSFEVQYRPPRQGRNPKSGLPVEIPAKYVPHFKPGKELRERVNFHNSPSTRRISEAETYLHFEG